MTKNILEVLTYMFDFLFEKAELGESHEIDDVTLKAHLSDAGFDMGRINRALRWLEDIAALQDGQINPRIATAGGVRIYSEEEKTKLSAKARGFLMYMENIGQMDAAQRETVIHQIMSLEAPDISLDDFKWVVKMVLGNTGKEPAGDHASLVVSRKTTLQ